MRSCLEIHVASFPEHAKQKLGNKEARLFHLALVSKRVSLFESSLCHPPSTALLEGNVSNRTAKSPKPWAPLSWFRRSRWR